MQIQDCDRSQTFVNNLEQDQPSIEELRGGVYDYFPTNMNLCTRKEETNIADYLSRHPSPVRDGNHIAEQYVNFIMNSSKPRAIDMSLMLSETANDNVIQKVIQLLKSGKLQHCKEKSVNSYKNIYSELTVSETGLLLRNRRIVLPKSLQEKAIIIAHEGHLGMTKTKSLTPQQSMVSNNGQDGRKHNKCMS